MEQLDLFTSIPVDNRQPFFLFGKTAIPKINAWEDLVNLYLIRHGDYLTTLSQLITILNTPNNLIANGFRIDTPAQDYSHHETIAIDCKGFTGKKIPFHVEF